MFTETVSYSAAFVAGLLSFFSPCVLPLIPAYFTFISGLTLEELTDGYTAEIRRKVFFSTMSFIAGFSVIFILLGASASYLGGLTHDYRGIIRVAGGALIVILGIHLTGMVRIPFLDFEKKFHLKQKPLNIFRNIPGRHGLWCRVEPLYRTATRLHSRSGHGQGHRLARHRAC